MTTRTDRETCAPLTLPHAEDIRLWPDQRDGVDPRACKAEERAVPGHWEGIGKEANRVGESGEVDLTCRPSALRRSVRDGPVSDRGRRTQDF